MESKILKNLVPVILTLVIVVAGCLAANFILKNISPDQKGSPAEEKKINFEVDKKTYDTISNQSSASINISLDESGFGRENPFAPYK